MPAKVLVVDDSLELCEFIQQVLISEKIQTHVLTDSTMAAEQLQLQRFDAVFLDMRMPPPDGIELARQIRAAGINKTTPLVMITGDSDHTLMGRAFQVGVNFLLYKPVDRTRLLRLLNAANNFIYSEKRRFARVNLRIPVVIASGEHPIRGTTLDLSLGGMSVRASETLPVGSTAQVTLSCTPPKRPLCLTARVMRVHADDFMGLQIEQAGSEERKALQELLLPLLVAHLG